MRQLNSPHSSQTSQARRESTRLENIEKIVSHIEATKLPIETANGFLAAKRLPRGFEFAAFRTFGRCVGTYLTDPNGVVRTGEGADLDRHINAALSALESMKK